MQIASIIVAPKAAQDRSLHDNKSPPLSIPNTPCPLTKLLHDLSFPFPFSFSLSLSLSRSLSLDYFLVSSSL